MPTIPFNAKVLVTGPNGYIGLWVVKAHLDRGHTVRAAVRSEARANDLKVLFPTAGDKLEFVIVDDMLKVRITFEWNAHRQLNVQFCRALTGRSF